MVEIFRKSLEFSSIFLITLILFLSKASGNQINLSKSELEPQFETLVERSHLSVMEIQQTPEKLSSEVSSWQQSNYLDQTESGVINFPYQKSNFIACVDSKAKCELSQVTSVEQLSDVKPTDWAYTAIKSLIERHKLNLNTYFGEKLDGNQVLTRYEFADILNDIMTQISKPNKINFRLDITNEELQIVQKLQIKFNSELGNLTTRIDKLEPKIAKNTDQFSPTTKFSGDALFTLSAAATSEKQEGNLTFGYRTRLNFNTSFIGKDSLRIRLQARNIPRFDNATETDMTRLAFQGGNNNNRVSISRLDYSFPINKQLRVSIPVIGGSLQNFTDPLNPYLSGSSKGAISRFAQRNPIYRHGNGSGIGLSYEINDSLELEAGFLARNANNPETGLNRGAYGAIAQLTIEPVEDMEFGLTYIHSYNNLDTGTGSELANDPFNDNSNAISANSFGLQSSIKISPNITLGGWIGYTNATALDLPNNPSASIFNWAFTLALPNLGSQENLAGFVIGQPPKVINNDFIDEDTIYSEKDNSLHLEAFYRLQTHENITVSFGLLTIINPEHNSNNDTVYVGTMRTTFNF